MSTVVLTRNKAQIKRTVLFSVDLKGLRTEGIDWSLGHAEAWGQRGGIVLVTVTSSSPQIMCLHLVEYLLSVLDNCHPSYQKEGCAWCCCVFVLEICLLVWNRPTCLNETLQNRLPEHLHSLWRCGVTTSASMTECIENNETIRITRTSLHKISGFIHRSFLHYRRKVYEGAKKCICVACVCVCVPPQAVVEPIPPHGPAPKQHLGGTVILSKVTSRLLDDAISRRDRHVPWGDDPRAESSDLLRAVVLRFRFRKKAFRGTDTDPMLMAVKTLGFLKRPGKSYVD